MLLLTFVVSFFPIRSENGVRFVYYPVILVDDIDAAGLIFSHNLVVGPHRRADDEVVEAVAVQIAGSDGVAEVGADLIPRQVVEIRQVGVVDQDLEGNLSSSYYIFF